MNRLTLAKHALAEADFVLIGAGAGFSAAAGLTYSGSRFNENFRPFIERYEMTDMYSAGFYPFPNEESRWAYWAEHSWQNRWLPEALPLYRDLWQLVREKNYFVITTNVDAQFEKAGFEPERIFAVQGDYSKLQCAKACHETLYSNEELVKKWRNQTAYLPKTVEIPAALVPKCPVCGGKMAMHLRIDGNFVQNADWYAAEHCYAAFAEQAMSGKTVYLELGVGFNTPAIIRYPFEQMTYRNPQATLIRLNRYAPQGFSETAAQTLAFSENPSDILTALLGENHNDTN